MVISIVSPSDWAPSSVLVDTRAVSPAVTAESANPPPGGGGGIGVLEAPAVRLAGPKGFADLLVLGGSDRRRNAGRRRYSDPEDQRIRGCGHPNHGEVIPAAETIVTSRRRRL